IRSRILAGPGKRLNPIYDATVLYPQTTLIISGMPYQGVELDLEIEFDDESVRDADSPFQATARVDAVVAGGVTQHFSLPGPLDLQGTFDTGYLDTGLFGPIRVGNADLIVELAGSLADDRRRVIGNATLYGTDDAGTFLAIKRRRYLVAGTDLQVTGEAAVITMKNEATFMVDNALELISADPVARVEDGRPFVVNRDTYDNLEGLDPFGDFKAAFQYALGDRANPHDVVVLPPGTPGAAPAGAGIALVTRYGPSFNDVAVVSLDDGAILDRIDLTPFALNPDHTPRADQALFHDNLVYVTLEDVDRSFTHFMNGRVAVIDPASRAVIDVIDLAGQNPFESLVYAPETGLIYVGLAGIFPGILPRALTGGIEAIDPITRTSRGLVVDDDALGGNITALAVASATRGYAVVADASFRNFLKAWNPTTGEVLETLYSGTDPINDIAYDGDGLLLVAVGSFFDPHVLIFDAATGGLLAALPARLPPFSIATLTRSL
ncbi:MAG TPA: hypothetical protein VGA64_04605, partial [Candidatus Polarisedimenticolia bacterium]